MKLDIYKRGLAKNLQPGDVIEYPKALTVQSVTNSFDGIKVTGFPPGEGRKLRANVDLKPEDEVRYAVEDTTAVVDLLATSLRALVKQNENDGDDETLSWQLLGDGVFLVTDRGRGLDLTVAVADAKPVKATKVEKAAPAEAPKK